jgi:hypothetical protein
MSCPAQLSEGHGPKFSRWMRATFAYGENASQSDVEPGKLECLCCEAAPTRLVRLAEGELGSLEFADDLPRPVKKQRCKRAQRAFSHGDDSNS